MNKEIIENEEIKGTNFDSTDIFIVLVGVGLMIMCILFGFSLYRKLDETEEHCVSYYKENHYITESCKKYSNKLEALYSNENKR